METKICSCKECIYLGQEQSISNFHKNKNNQDGYHHYCKTCRKTNDKQSKEYLEKNKQNKQQYDKEYRKNNNQKKKANDKIYTNSLSLFNIFFDKLNKYEECRQDPNNPELLQVRCTYCGSWFNPVNYIVRNRLYSLSTNNKGESHFYCSDGCKGACPIYGTILYPKDFIQPMESREVNPQFRKLVLERDNYSCQKCGKTKEDGASLHCHHIQPYINEPMLDCDLDNGITLCRECHISTHQSIDGCGFSQLKCI